MSSSLVGAPLTIKTRLEFAVHHDVAPVTKHYLFDQGNEALERLEKGDTRYRIVLSHKL